MRILVTGSRNWDDEAQIRLALMETVAERLMNDDEGVIIIHGDAPGADTIAAQFAESMNWTVEAYPADWKKFGRSAGPIRNQQMVDSGADICVAFPQPGSVGTRDCTKRAFKAGIRVRTYEPV